MPDLGSILAAAAPTSGSLPPTLPRVMTPTASPWQGYQNAILAQSRLPRPPQGDPRSFPVPAPFRPNMTKPNGITSTPQVPPLPGPANASHVAQPGKPTPGVPTSPTASRVSTPFSDYRGTTMGSESGHLASVKGFTS